MLGLPGPDPSWPCSSSYKPLRSPSAWIPTPAKVWSRSGQGTRPAPAQPILAGLWKDAPALSSCPALLLPRAQVTLLRIP